MKKSNYVIAAILVIVYGTNVMFTTLNNARGKLTVQHNKKFAGSASCAGCHKNIYDTHIQTAHYNDSRPADKASIKGNFSNGKNTFVYNKWMKVMLEKKGGNYYQTAYLNETETQSEPFDITIGSGRKGQTYLYWDGNTLYQLPVSYYTPLNTWCNSPGFSNNYIKFDRMIPAQCLECHGTYASVNEQNNQLPVYDKASIMYGVDCERCHGAAAEHVEFHMGHPEEKTAKFIVSSAMLSRQQKLDACALCHSGFREALQPAFSFVTGDKLDDFSKARYSTDSTASLDVHGNQYGLLTASKCFQLSQMDCASCHNVHVNEANKTEVFSQRCITCHQQVSHKTFTQDQKALFTNNCIDCHMPVLSSKKIILDVSGSDKPVPDLIRTHKVAIYPEFTARFLKKNMH